MDQNPPEAQFNQQPIPPQPSVTAAEVSQPFTITGPSEPIQEDPINQFVQHPAPPPTEAPPPSQFAPAQPAPEAQAAQFTVAVQPGPEAVAQPATETPYVPPVFQPSLEAAPPSAPALVQPLQQTAPSPTPWDQTVAPIPAEPVTGLSPDATATPAPTPQTATEEAVLKSMEPGNAELIANNREPLGVAIAEAAQAEASIPKIPVTEVLSNSENKDIIPAPIEEVIENGKKGLSLVEGTKLEGPFLEGFAGGVAISTGYKKAA